MRLFLALSCLAAVALATPLADYTGYRVLRVQVDNEAQGRFLQTLEDKFDFWNDIPRRGHADIMVAPGDRTLETMLKTKGLRFSTMMEDVGAVIAEQKAHHLRHKAANAEKYAKQNHNMDWEDYHELEDIYGWLEFLAGEHNGLVSVESIGNSYEGREMRVVSVCQDGCGNKPAMYIDSGIHAREWITPATNTYMLNELVSNAENAELLSGLDWYFLFSVNPDGYAYTFDGDRLWRKTRAPNAGSICVGTDANRNFDNNWGVVGSSDNPCAETFHGDSAFSEVETQNVRDFLSSKVESDAGRVRFVNSIHSYSQYILLPWGWTGTNNPNHDAQMALANEGYEALNSHYGTEYEIGSIYDVIYAAAGGTIDWAFESLGIEYTYSFELRDTGRYGFLLPADQIIPSGIETWAFHQVAARSIINEFGKKN